MRALKEDKDQLERKCASLDLENKKLGSQYTQLLMDNHQTVLKNT